MKKIEKKIPSHDDFSIIEDSRGNTRIHLFEIRNVNKKIVSPRNRRKLAAKRLKKQKIMISKDLTDKFLNLIQSVIQKFIHLFFMNHHQRAADNKPGQRKSPHQHFINRTIEDSVHPPPVHDIETA